MATAPKGRLLKLTAESQKTIVEAVASGVPLKYAAAKVGISERSILRYLQHAREKKNGRLVSFLSDIKKAESDFIAHHLGYISKDRSWQSRAWLLERIFRDTFGTDAKMLKEMNRLLKLATKVR